MSSNLAYVLPSPGRRQLEEQFEESPRSVRVVTTRAQRRARPKAVYALVATGAIFVIFLIQLLLTIALSSGAYRIADLQNTQKSLTQTQSALSERLDTLGSVQNLAANAQQLGMVDAANPAYLRLSDGSVAGTPVPAAASAPTIVANGATDAVPNSLLTNVPVISPTGTGHDSSNTAELPSTGTQSSGETSSGHDSTASGSTTDTHVDPNVIASPTTH